VHGFRRCRPRLFRKPIEARPLIEQVAVSVGGRRPGPSSRGKPRRRLQLDEPVKDRPDPAQRRLLWIMSLRVADLIAQRGPAAPSTCLFFPRSGRPLSRIRSPMTSRSYWAKVSIDVQMHASHSVGRIERLRYRDKRGLMPLETARSACENPTASGRAGRPCRRPRCRSCQLWMSFRRRFEGQGRSSVAAGHAHHRRSGSATWTQTFPPRWLAI